MLYDKIFESLNESQRSAVETLEGPVLVLAGAGSGKTTVLTLRIANLLLHKVKPENILATTFTNKAAEEMKVRLTNLLGGYQWNINKLWVGTFHSICVKLLRQYAKLIGYEPDFSILDEEDSRELIRSVMDSLNVDIISKDLAAYLISRQKAGIPVPAEYNGIITEIAGEYNKRLKLMNSMDFDDILLNFLRLLDEYENVRKTLEERFLYIHVDEFQDLNQPQYDIIRKLRKEIRNVFAVGDDDQSIYGFRNAQVKFILQFPRDFRGTKIITLERNYRSTAEVLRLANRVIAFNINRYGKVLKTDKRGLKPEMYQAVDDLHEARYIARRILELYEEGYNWSDIAILYRVNHLSRKLEESLITSGIPYKVYGGIGFYQRKEIKDLLAYLKLVANPRDNISLMRIINVPPRGIGQATIRKIALIAERSDICYFEAIGEAVKAGLGLSRTQSSALKEFVQLITDLRELYNELYIDNSDDALYRLLEELIKRTDYTYYIERRLPNPQERLENIMELLNAVREFEVKLTPETDHRDPLSSFLEWITLVSQIDKDMDKGEVDAVKLMTMHSAKGLEFRAVFLPALEEDIIPHYKCQGPDELEEERRLLYVAITRAKERLFLSWAEERRVGGMIRRRKLTRFLDELPNLEELVLMIDTADSYSVPVDVTETTSSSERFKPRSSCSFTTHSLFNLTGALERVRKAKPKTEKLHLFRGSSIKPGDKVSHSLHGRGIVLKVYRGRAKVSFLGKVKTVSLKELRRL